MKNEADFRVVYEEYKNLVYNLALHYLQQTGDAEDAAQDVFVKVYQHWERHDPVQASLKTWIYRITINHCLDLLRRKRSKKRFGFLRPLFQQGTHEPVAIADPDHPGIAAEDKEGLSLLLRLIGELPENQRTALILMKIEDRSQKETAEIMNTSPKAVESLLQRARQNLEKKLRQARGSAG